MQNYEQLVELIDKAFAEADPGPYKAAVAEALRLLDSGDVRVAEKTDSGWQINQWVKKAILLHFKLHHNQIIEHGPFNYFDKVGIKYADYNADQFIQDRVRVVPPAVARQGVYIAENCVLMPSYTNIGAYIDSGTMVDIWATIGSCAQIGKNCHISSNVCIGGVLEPLQSNPVIIEDNCFIGTGAAIVEGIIVEENCIIGMGVRIGQSTKIYDRVNDCLVTGRIPAGSVVVPGSMPSADGKYNLDCAIITKSVDADTRAKVDINQLLRDTA